jgi:hypothetical protein
MNLLHLALALLKWLRAGCRTIAVVLLLLGGFLLVRGAKPWQFNDSSFADLMERITSERDVEIGLTLCAVGIGVLSVQSERLARRRLKALREWYDRKMLIEGLWRKYQEVVADEYLGRGPLPANSELGEVEKSECSRRQCRHFIGAKKTDGDEATERLVCRAFPGGIPAEIAHGGNDHTKPYKGDRGIRYERA